MPESHAKSLDTGTYLACTETSMRSCAFLDVASGQTRTVHLNHGGGQPTRKLFDTTGNEDSDASFTLSP